MEGRKKAGSSPSPSSFTSELFGSRENSSSSSSEIFESIFAPPSKGLGRESLRPDGWNKPADSLNDAWNDKPAATGDSNRSGEQQNSGVANQDSGFYQEQRVQPCHLSSSIYYGGQDVYCQPQSNTGSSVNSTYKKDVGEDDSGSASRGNWWKGSLYY